jgi:hypothetical protein
MNILLSTRSRVRFTSVLAALAFVFAGLTSAYAVYYGLVNPSFGSSGQCSLSGWTTYGIAKADKTSDGKCFALIMVNTAGTGGRGSTTQVSGIEQTFVVHPNAPMLQLFLKPYSDQPNTTFAAQTITLRDSNGGLIYQGSRNSQIANENHNNLLELDLSGYAGQSVRLNIDVQIDTSMPDSPTAVRLNIDSMPIIVGEGPEIPPGGGW